MSVVNMLPSGASLVNNYYIFGEQARKLTDSNTSNIVSITGTNSTITGKMTSPWHDWEEWNFGGTNNIVVQFTKPVRAARLIYEAYAQNYDSRYVVWVALDGSNDGSTWTELVYQDVGKDNSHSSTPHVIPLTVKGSYQYYRYRINVSGYIFWRHPFDIVIE